MDLKKIAVRVAAGTVGPMTVGGLIAELQKADPNAPVSVRVSGPKDAMVTDEVGVTVGTSVVIEGWQGSEPDED